MTGAKYQVELQIHWRKTDKRSLEQMKDDLTFYLHSKKLKNFEFRIVPEKGDR